MDIKFNCMDKKFFILIACFIFNGCGWNSDPGEKSNVLYIDCYYTIVPLINPDGTPKLYGK